MAFQDHFSTQAAGYGRARPRYPGALIDHLAAVAPSVRLALDVATGNGQAALGLVTRFERVLASDPSAAQLAVAPRHPRVQYLRHEAERLPVAGGVADLVAVAQAAHWLDLERFYAEARRVLRPGGVLALWTYGLVTLDEACDACIARFYAERIGRYWPPERRHVESAYQTLPFPFPALPAPPFELVAELTLAGLVDYIGTWSAVIRCQAAEGRDPVPELAGALAAVWGGSAHRTVRWPLHLRLGRVVPI